MYTSRMNFSLENLNSSQKAAATQTEGRVRVVAGAGAGKTRTLTSRYCFLVSEAGVAPENILCATFTNRAANEMKARVRAALGDMDLSRICTFHAFCVQLLKEDINVLNYPKNFIVMDTQDERDILLRIFGDMGLTMRDTTIQSTIDRALEARKMKADSYIDDIYQMDNDALRAKALAMADRDDQIFARYIYEQKKNFALDFNDLINFATYILEKFPAVREKWRERTQYVMVDEFQDVSEKQYRIARILSEKHENLFIVGDSDQTIYSWRGSHVKMFLDFDKKYPDAKTFTLTQNYRSTPEIILAANALISKNTVRYPKDLVPTRPSGEKPVYRHCASEREEAEWICEKIKALAQAGADYGSIAVLYRAQFVSRAIEERLVDEKIPYKFYSGVEFYNRAEIKDAVCYLRMIASADDMAFMRTVNMPSRKIGKKKIEFLRADAEKNNRTMYESLKASARSEMFRATGAARYVDAIESVRAMKGEAPLGTLLQAAMDKSGYEEFLRLQSDQERLDNIAEFRRAVEKAGQDDDASLEDFLARVALYTDQDASERRSSVKLMTIHAAKGMEFRHVFVCAMSEGIFPSRKTFTKEDMEEERRIAYVAFTRAEDSLFISDSEGTANDNLFKYPSRFIFDTGLENLNVEKAPDDSLVARSKKAISASEAQLAAFDNVFQKGARVRHAIFGDGTVSAANEKGGVYLIKFDSLKTERAIRFGTKLAPIES